ncbi:MAG: phage capsid protein [Pseudomonadota bacterium]
MAEIADQILYRDEWIQAFERDQAMLRDAVTTEAMIKGRQAVFLVAGSGREAVTRGANGLIPATADDLTQNTVTLNESHDLSQKTGFNIFAGQSDQRAIMQAQGRNVINRSIDNKIIAALNTGTVAANTTASPMTKQLVNKAKVLLGNANAMQPGKCYAAVTPAAWSQLEDVPAFSSADYVMDRPQVDGYIGWRLWNGIKWCQHTGLTGLGTASATCLMWNQEAVGHAYDTKDVQALAGYEEEQDYSWARTSIYDNALRLQNTGIVKMLVNDTAI